MRWPSCKARIMASARGLPLAATAPMPSMVSSKSSVVNFANASSRLAACAFVQAKAGTRTKPKASSSAARQARQKRIAKKSRGDYAGRRFFRRLPASSNVSVPPLRRAAALLRHLVVVAAFELHPIGFEILRAGQVRRPGGAGNELLGLEHHVELAVGPDLADIDRLGDVMVRQQGRDAAGEVRR